MTELVCELGPPIPTSRKQDRDRTINRRLARRTSEAGPWIVGPRRCWDHAQRLIQRNPERLAEMRRDIFQNRLDVDRTTLVPSALSHNDLHRTAALVTRACRDSLANRGALPSEAIGRRIATPEVPSSPNPHVGPAGGDRRRAG